MISLSKAGYTEGRKTLQNETLAEDVIVVCVCVYTQSMVTGAPRGSTGRTNTAKGSLQLQPLSPSFQGQLHSAALFMTAGEKHKKIHGSHVFSFYKQCFLRVTVQSGKHEADAPQGCGKNRYSIWQLCVCICLFSYTPPSLSFSVPSFLTSSSTATSFSPVSFVIVKLYKLIIDIDTISIIL